MKKVFLLFSMLVFSGLGFTKHEIKFEVSPLGNLVYQLDCMAQIAHFRCSYVDFNALWQGELKAAEKDNNSDESMLAEWKTLRTNLDKNVSFTESPDVTLATSPNFPMNEGQGMNVLEQARVMAFAVKTQDAYAQNLSYWLPFSHVQSELKIINHFKPRFDQWFSQQQLGLAEFVTEAQALSTEVGVDDLLTSMRIFYRSEIPADLILPVYLIAHPKAQASTSGLVFNESSLIEVLKGESAKSRLAVVIHEISHFYHSRASIDWHQKVMNKFTAADSKVGNVGYYLYNEGLAAAIGNGLFESLAKDAEYFKKYLAYPMSFYADEGIDTAAKAALPLVRSYIDQKKNMDDDFLKQLDLVWADALSEIKNSPKQRFRHVAMVVLDEQLDDLINELFGLLRPSSAQINTTSDGDTAEILAINKYPSLDAIILASDVSQLKPLKLAGLNAEKLAELSADNFQVFFNVHGAARLVIVSDSPEFINQTVSNVLAQKTFDDTKK